MGFWDVFVKVWQVRTSIRIQESLENSFRNNRRSKTFDNLQEIVGALIRNNDSWQRKLNAHRNQDLLKTISLNCEFCGCNFKAVEVKNNSNSFNGWVYYNSEANKITNDLIIEISSQLKDDSDEHPLFFCSKKCSLSDTILTPNSTIG
jgi:hypothetical protein